MDYAVASGEAAGLEIDAGIGQRQDGLLELPGQDLRVLAEGQKLVGQLKLEDPVESQRSRPSLLSSTIQTDLY